MKKYLYYSTIIFHQSSHIFLKERRMVTFLNTPQFTPVCNFILTLRQDLIPLGTLNSFGPLVCLMAVSNSSRIRF